MTPKPRHKRNRGLPTGWRLKNGWYSYRPNRHTQHLFEGKTEFPLGKTLATAYRVFGQRMEGAGQADTMVRLLDRYEVEITPGKAQATQNKERARIRKLREIFGRTQVCDVEAHHCYRVRDAIAQAHGPTQANRHMETLSHALTKAVEWGVIKTHPMIHGGFKKLHIDVQRRLPEHWEIDEALSVAPPLIRAYVGLKRLTGLRQTDLLRLKREDWQEDGLHVTPSKTQRSSGKRLIFGRDADLEAAVEACLALQVNAPGSRPRVAGQYFFCTRKGQPYTPDGFASIWQRWMKRALHETRLEQKFTERSIRTYVGSWSESDQDAADRLGHSSTSTTRKHYRERATVVRPLKVEK